MKNYEKSPFQYFLYISFFMTEICFKINYLSYTYANFFQVNTDEI